MKLLVSKLYPILLFLIFSTFSYPISGHSQENREEIKPPDVFAHVMLLRNEIELVRWYMGIPKPKKMSFDVKYASPREVFYQALTLFRKSNQLSLEVVGSSTNKPKTPSGPLEPRDVYQVVDLALKRILKVKSHLQIKEAGKKPRRKRSKTPSDVFKSILQINRQLNLMVDKNIAPKDVYEQVALAVNYTTKLIEKFPKSKKIVEPRFIPGKRPKDVYQRLLSCFELIGLVSSKQGIRIAQLGDVNKRYREVEPSDVYDIATLIVSELVYLHNLAGISPPKRVARPQRKYPSDVFQRAGQLEEQLTHLLRRVSSENKRLIES